ncbi:hypothetical protein Q5P01_007115 [Channa striata]|uniref:Immunoglobulin subtype domain-containing protein n=1 Tax=Channa striata TaxID=64152 RepID=A0AA88STH5_CHASR|nr:hypothetical protein Q5P01_007115 [Channa striata]
MKIQNILFFWFSSALCAANTGLVGSKLAVFTAPQGGSGTMYCYLSLSGSWKFFCKDECAEGDILIKTENQDSYRKKLSCFSVNHKRSPELLDGDYGFVRTVAAGEEVIYGCNIDVKKGRMFFCKDQCKQEKDIYIDTSDDTARSGRYSIKYTEGSVFGLYVTITQVTKSDTGWYRCGYGEPSSPDSFLRFQILVVDAVPSTSATTTFFNSNPESHLHFFFSFTRNQQSLKSYLSLTRTGLRPQDVKIPSTRALIQQAKLRTRYTLQL